MNEKDPLTSQGLSFDSALERLQQIVRSLETGTLSLEESLRSFEEGVRLARSCQSHLTVAEQRVEQLIRVPEDGTPPESAPFPSEKP